MHRRLTALAVALSLVPAAARAQMSRADSLLGRGLLDRAESEYYAAVRARPRDPDARWRLGNYLIARGALRIGATLIDEAMQFGFDKQMASSVLAAVYLDLGEYQSAASLPASPLSANEKALVRWLIEHPSRAIAPDSAVLVALTRPAIDGFVGATRIRIDGQPVIAMIAPRTGCGVQLSDTSAIASKLHRFPTARPDLAQAIPAAADSIGYGRMTITNVPVTLQKLGAGVQAVLCFGSVMRFAPTFDTRAGLLTLRLGGKVPAPAAASTGFPFLAWNGELSIARAGGWVPIAQPQVFAMLRDRRWTLDARRGLIVLEP